MTQHAQAQTALFGSISLGSVWQVLVSISKHAPNWELVPPILVGLIGLVGALNTALNDRHRRRREREELDAQLAQAAADAAARRESFERFRALITETPSARAMDGPSLN